MKVSKVEKVYRAIRVDAKISNKDAKFYFITENKFEENTVELYVEKVTSSYKDLNRAIDDVIAQLDEMVKDLTEFKEKSGELKNTFHLYEGK